jgi:enediyne biosynthesis protein E4
MPRSRFLATLISLMMVALFGCDQDEASSVSSEEVTPLVASGPNQSLEMTTIAQPVKRLSAGAEETSAQFANVAHQSGLDFIYDRGSYGDALMSEAIGGGVGWLDYDLDGLMDLVLVQGGNPIERESNLSDQLFRQLSNDSFQPIPAAASGINEHEYGQGVGIADFNNDGFDDVYITNIGQNQLWQNQGDGTFHEVTSEAGMEGAHLWSTSCAWGDLNKDGNLDLFVCNYLNYDPNAPVPCFDAQGKKSTCDPNEIDPVPNDCYLNSGDGQFEQIATSSGLRSEGSKSLGVVIADFDNDQLPDIFVSNDTTSNFLYMAQSKLFYSEEAIVRGCAMSGLGNNQASMGVAFGDYNQDGRFDLYVTHFEDDSNTLYENLGNALFRDVTRPVGLHLSTVPHLGFGTVMADFNLNGQQDLFIANGHIDDWSSQGKPWKMPAQLFSFQDPEWVELSHHGGDYFTENKLGRGVASCDYDRNGTIDLVVVNQDEETALLKNVSPSVGHAVQIELIGRESNRTGIGTRINVTQDNQSWVSELAGGTSYCSSHDHCINVGIGKNRQPCQIQIRWPSGIEETLDHIDVGQRVTVIEGSGIVRTQRFEE